MYPCAMISTGYPPGSLMVMVQASTSDVELVVRFPLVPSSLGTKNSRYSIAVLIPPGPFGGSVRPGIGTPSQLVGVDTQFLLAGRVIEDVLPRIEVVDHALPRRVFGRHDDVRV